MDVKKIISFNRVPYHQFCKREYVACFAELAADLQQCWHVDWRTCERRFLAISDGGSLALYIKMAVNFEFSVSVLFLKNLCLPDALKISGD